MTMAGADDHGRLPGASRVEALVGLGLSALDIARLFDLDRELVERVFARELAAGQIKANARVAESLYRKAVGDGRQSVTAAIFWLKARGRWKETIANEVTHDIGDPLQMLLSDIAERGSRLVDVNRER
jgi:hypothetical protein